MNQIIQKLAATAGMLLGTATLVAADPVTFKVNMSVQAALGNFNPANGDTVLIGGNWDGWTATNDVLALTATPNVYAITVNLTAGSYPNYKFIIDPGGNSIGNSLEWEVPASFGGGDRYFQVPTGGTNLPAVFFNDNTNMPTYTVDISFQVDLASAIQQGIFTIGSDYVDVFGSFNGWSTANALQLTNVPGTSNYMATLSTTSLSTNGTVVDYKYAIDGNGGTWEGNVGPNGTQNRVFTVTNLTEILPLDYWDNLTNVSTSYNVQFTIDVIAEDALGNFTPGFDNIFVAGDWNWSATAVQLTQSSTNADVYTGTVPLVYSPGTTVNYKYIIDGSVWENNGVGPGGAANHEFTLAGNTNLPTDNYNDYTSLGPIVLSQTGSQTAVTWASGTNSANRMWLQSTTNLLNGWTDVPNTQGQGGITNNFGPAPVFFRLIGPTD